MEGSGPFLPLTQQAGHMPVAVDVATCHKNETLTSSPTSAEGTDKLSTNDLPAARA